MFGVTPWRNVRNEVAPGSRGEHPFAVLDRLLDRWFAPTTNVENGNWWGGEFKEEEKEYVLSLDAPGFEAGDFNIHLEGETLRIDAERKVEDKGEARVLRKFQRFFTLPTTVEGDKVEANYRNGVLELHLPKVPQVQPRKIEVKVS
jgi:HSP20 family protein